MAGAIVSRMRRVVLDEVDLGSVEEAVGAAAYAAGYSEMEDGVVRRMEWVPARRALSGVVRDSGGEFHETVAYFSPSSPMRLAAGYCSCEVGCECKHAAALALAGALASGQDLSAPRARSLPWDQLLTSLTQPKPPAAGRGLARLAIELILSGADQPSSDHRTAVSPRLTIKARVVQPGAKLDSWVGGQLTWDKLDSRLYIAGQPDAQLRVLKELYWTHRAGDRAGYRPLYGGEKLLDLAAFESSRLWSLLDEAESVGVPLVYRRLGAIPKYGTAELFLDVIKSDPSGPLRISPVLAVDDSDDDVWPLCFLGSEAHGVAYVDRTEVERSPDPARWRFRLARLINPVPTQLHQLATSRESLTVPAAEERRFCEEFYPRLRHAASIISSDGSFPLPAISPPTLVLGASYSAGHELDVRWEWAYQVGDLERRTPVSPAPGAPGR